MPCSDLGTFETSLSGLAKTAFCCLPLKYGLPPKKQLKSGSSGCETFPLAWMAPVRISKIKSSLREVGQSHLDQGLTTGVVLGAQSVRNQRGQANSWALGANVKVSASLSQKRAAFQGLRVGFRCWGRFVISLGYQGWGTFSASFSTSSASPGFCLGWVWGSRLAQGWGPGLLGLRLVASCGLWFCWSRVGLGLV